MNKETLQSLTQQLAAIEMPPPPNWQPYIIGGIVTAAIILIISALFLRHRRGHQTCTVSTSQIALKKLEQLYSSWQTGKLNDQNTAYQLATILRLGLKLKQLTNKTPASIGNDNNWQDTIQLLQTLRYNKKQDVKLNKQVFEQIDAWLRHESVSC